MTEATEPRHEGPAEMMKPRGGDPGRPSVPVTSIDGSLRSELEITWRSAARTDRGAVRLVNEDQVLERPAAGLWAVADGMGGHERGAYASGLVKSALLGLSEGADLDGIITAARDALLDVDSALRGSCDNCGSTIVALFVRGERFACLWAGDSRLYRLRRGQLQRLTNDHSLVAELIESGAIEESAAKSHPLGHYVTRAVGVGKKLELDGLRGKAEPGDRFLLTSDGMHNVIDHERLAALAGESDPAAAADRLLAAALDAGAPDNVSLVLVQAEAAPIGARTATP